MAKKHLLIFGLGYTASRLAAVLRPAGWTMTATSRTPRGGTLVLDDSRLIAAITDASHILSSVPPDDIGPLFDPVLRQFGSLLAAWPGKWLGYLSTTGVYGDCQGGWVDEMAPTGTRLPQGRQSNRYHAEQHWQALGGRSAAPVHIFRLPGIYGPDGRSALDRVREGRANRIDLAGSGIADHVFCRVHVDDIVATLQHAMDAPGGRGTSIFNVADDLPASGNAVVEHACDLLGLAYPPIKLLSDPSVTPMARSFYADCRRVKNDKIKRVLGVKLRYPTYNEGLAACMTELAT